MKNIILRGYKEGKRIIKAYALVDNEDYDNLFQYKWFLHKTGYVVRTVNFKKDNKPKTKSVYLHIEVLNFPLSDIDHKDGNKLNCQKDNLRLCTHSQNMGNRRKNSNNYTSIYKGVSFHSRSKYWIAYCGHKSVGVFDTEERAALAYNKAAIRKFGEFAKLNIIKE